jgi:hypothetical protein
METRAYQILSQYFHLPLLEASVKMGMDVRDFRQLCRESGIDKWRFSYKKHNKLEVRSLFQKFSSTTLHQKVQKVKVSETWSFYESVPRSEDYAQMPDRMGCMVFNDKSVTRKKDPSVLPIPPSIKPQPIEKQSKMKPPSIEKVIGESVTQKIRIENLLN